MKPHQTARIAATAAAVLLGSVITGCSNSPNSGSDIHMPPNPQQEVQAIQNNPNMPAAAKAQAIAALQQPKPKK